jgi:hypothetical protein
MGFHLNKQKSLLGRKLLGLEAMSNLAIEGVPNRLRRSVTPHV